ncbi:kinase-like protein [Teratosphaeria nubilosa]|uniref:non-specific serine/threonine protein kinase n=1 Tax=Teratosphaeria nubilosa TaxID=161662 RepID=A0A6G1KY95_9PEZI|nr:kinase-like protein [Teratosphaeria nubilosa]
MSTSKGAAGDDRQEQIQLDCDKATASWDRTISALRSDGQDVERWTQLYEQASALFAACHKVIYPPNIIGESGALKSQKRTLACEFAIAAHLWSEQYFVNNDNREESLAKIARVMAAGLSIIDDGNTTTILPSQDKFGDRGRTAYDLGFGGVNVGIPGTWVFEGTLGQGNLGHAGLWAKYDTNGRKTEAVVVKETYLSESDWNGEWFWQGNPVDRMPREVYIHQKLSSCPSACNIVTFRGHSIHESHRMYRIYMEYCRHGDLEQVIRLHASLNQVKAVDGSPLPQEVTHIPELALFGIFEQLLAGASFIKGGRRGPPASAWETILHGDIKPENISLGERDGNTYRFLPQPKIGDFGIAKPVTDAKKLVGNGTEAYMAPEQRKYQDPEHNKKRTVPTAAVDIFAIGKTMLSLMELTNRDETKAYGFDVGKAVVPMSADINFYNLALRQWVQQCLMASPISRPYVNTLWDNITRNTEAAAHGSSLAPRRWRDLPPNQQLMYKGSDRYEKWAL